MLKKNKLIDVLVLYSAVGSTKFGEKFKRNAKNCLKSQWIESLGYGKFYFGELASILRSDEIAFILRGDGFLLKGQRKFHKRFCPSVLE